MWLIYMVTCCTLIVQLLAEQCLTPNNETAHCISLYSCPILIGAIATQNREQIKFVRESNCGGTAKDPLVCCGTSYNLPTLKDSASDAKYSNNKMNLLPSSTFCGYQHADDYYRTPNDNSIRITEFPWSARIKYQDDPSIPPDNKFLCVGSLINNRYVLTAAHCIINQPGYIPEVVQLGDYHAKNNTDCVQEGQFEEECSEPVQEFVIEKTIPHLNYRPSQHLNDIALIRLSEIVTYSDYVRPICLPFPERAAAKVGDTLLSTGWGKSSIHENSVEIKKKIFSRLVENSECAKAFTRPRKNITENQLCTKPFSNNSEFECKGDSGGPLMFNYRNQWQQVGIISYGIGCGLGFTDVYTSVEKYLNWILYMIEP